MGKEKITNFFDNFFIQVLTGPLTYKRNRSFKNCTDTWYKIWVDWQYNLRKTKN